LSAHRFQDCLLGTVIKFDEPVAGIPDNHIVLRVWTDAAIHKLRTQLVCFLGPVSPSSSITASWPRSSRSDARAHLRAIIMS